MQAYVFLDLEQLIIYLESVVAQIKIDITLMLKEQKSIENLMKDMNDWINSKKSISLVESINEQISSLTSKRKLGSYDHW
jgi:aconitase B